MQVLQPWIQRRKLAYVRHKHVILGLLRHLKQRALGRLLKEDGSPDTETIEKLVFISRKLFIYFFIILF